MARPGRREGLEPTNAVAAGAPAAVLCLDLDRFKAVNDMVGDALPRAVAGRLRSAVRDTDTVARLGGDEFAILQAPPGRRARDAAAVLAERPVDLVGRAYLVEGHLVNVGASVGIATLGEDGAGRDPDRALREADLALYRAKAEGRGTFRLFEPAMDARAQARRALELDLRRALALRELELHYQSQTSLATGAISGFEALLRWRHPARGLVPPGEFVPLAEEIGLIVPFGEWVLRTACREAARWPGDLSVAVNLSPIQFASPNLVPAVASALAASGLPARRLELEITESVLLEDNEAVLATLRRLRGLGARIVMDDFGTGYSSLSYLRSFPFDKVKIDRSFVRGLSSPADAGGGGAGGGRVRRHRARNRGPGRQLRHGDHRRGRGDRGAAAPDPRGGLHRGAGLPGQPGGAGGRDRRPARRRRPRRRRRRRRRAPGPRRLNHSRPTRRAARGGPPPAEKATMPDPKSLCRLVYYSRNALPGPEAAQAAEVRRILASSRRNNPRAGVTGALMFNGACFAQVLEGPREAVERTFERIQRDTRHTDVAVLQLATVGRRGFPAWSMAFVGRSTAGGALHGGLTRESGFTDPALLTGERLFDTLRELVLEEEGEGRPAA